MPQVLQRDELAAWCKRWLGATPTQMLFEIAHLSVVAGLRLTDGREVVVKAHPPADRIQGCVSVQRHLWAAGFPYPEPLAGPIPMGALTATTEAFVPGGMALKPRPESPRLFAEALAALIRLAPPVASVPTLAPPPAWIWWDHDQPGTWPLPMVGRYRARLRPAVSLVRHGADEASGRDVPAGACRAWRRTP